MIPRRAITMDIWLTKRCFLALQLGVLPEGHGESDGVYVYLYV